MFTTKPAHSLRNICNVWLWADCGCARIVFVRELWLRANIGSGRSVVAGELWLRANKVVGELCSLLRNMEQGPVQRQMPKALVANT